MQPDFVPKLQRLDARIPQWDTSSLIERRCPLCSSSGTPFCVRPDGLTVRSCGTCGLYFISPAPDAVQLDNFYAHYNERHRRSNDTSEEAVAAIRNAEPLADLRMAEIASLFPDRTRKTALDVGFGLGTDLFQLHKLGFAVEGIEFDEGAINFVRNKLGISTVHRATIDEVRGSYDVIILHDLVEHPLEPLVLLQRATSLLRPGGILSIWTPNVSHVTQENEPIAFRVDLEHMQYFTYESIAELARRLGLDIVHLEGVGFPSIRNIEIPPGSIKDPAWKRLLRSIPGAKTMIRLRRRKAGTQARQRMREGKYHLFCLLRKADRTQSNIPV
jgi:2-polyprenyl-3-methyl-5-hydroxy-6-metoxy-1,4-benzoquinol methylase